MKSFNHFLLFITSVNALPVDSLILDEGETIKTRSKSKLQRKDQCMHVPLLGTSAIQTRNNK